MKDRSVGVFVALVIVIAGAASIRGKQHTATCESHEAIDESASELVAERPPSSQRLGRAHLVSVQALMPARQSSANEIATGQLLVVDAAKRTITIAVEGGVQQIFKYTDETTMTGAQGGIAGLSEMTGRQVRLHYTMEGVDRVLRSIEVASAPAK